MASWMKDLCDTAARPWTTGSGLCFAENFLFSMFWLSGHNSCTPEIAELKTKGVLCHLSANRPCQNKTLIGEHASQIPHKYRIRLRIVRQFDRFFKLDNSRTTDYTIVTTKSEPLTGNSQLNEQR